MTLYFYNDWKRANRNIFLRTFDLTPSLSIHLYDDWKFESIRFSWLGYNIGFTHG